MTDPTAVPQDDQPENEVLRAARERRQQQEAAEATAAADRDAAKGDKKGFGWKTAAGIGVGSAAVLAALLYANRDKIR